MNSSNTLLDHLQSEGLVMKQGTQYFKYEATFKWQIHARLMVLLDHFQHMLACAPPTPRFSLLSCLTTAAAYADMFTMCHAHDQRTSQAQYAEQSCHWTPCRCCHSFIHCCHTLHLHCPASYYESLLVGCTMSAVDTSLPECGELPSCTGALCRTYT